MKNRLLRFSLLITSVGFITVFLSATLIEEGKKRVTSPQNSQEYLALIKNNQHTGLINPADVSQAREQIIENSQGSSRAYEFNWKERGPNNHGGRTRAILIDNRDETGNTIIAGSVMGGLYKSTNAANNWQKINEANANLHVTCLTQSSDGTIYAGTGEGFTAEVYTVFGEWGYDGGLMGSGIWKSTDGDKFSQLSATGEWQFINELAAQNGRLYASTNAGLKYSDDGGASWPTARTSDGEELTLNSQDVQIGSDGTVVAAVDNLCYVSADGDPGNFVLHSTDSTYDLPNSDVGRIEFAIAPTDPNIIYALVVNTEGALHNVYRSTDKGQTWYIVGPGGSESFNIFNTDDDVSEGQGLYTCAIEVFPNDPGHIFIGGVNIWDGVLIDEDGLFDWRVMSDETLNHQLITFPIYLPAGHHDYLFVPGSNNTFYIASNGGVSSGTINSEFIEFSEKNKDYIGSQFYTVSYLFDDRAMMGGAQDLGTILVGNQVDQMRGGDIWTTVNGFRDGKTGGYVNVSIIYPLASIYSRYPHPDKDGNEETFVRRNEFLVGTDWSGNMFDDQFSSDLFLTPFALWESFEDMNSGDSVDYSSGTDIAAGTTFWVESNTQLRPFEYTTPDMIPAHDTVMIPDPISSKFFIGGNDQVLMTKDIIRFNVDPEWWVISDSDHGGVTGNPQCMAYSADANHLFVGTQDGKLYRISNIATAYNFDRADVSSPFSIISTSQLPIYLPGTTEEISQVITSVAVDPNNANKVIVTLGNYGNDHYVYMTNDALSASPTFESIQSNLPLMPAYASLFEMDANNDLIIIGTEYGIFVTEDANGSNTTWRAENAGIGMVPVMMLKQQTLRKEVDEIPTGGGQYDYWPGVNNYGVIYGATYGRGLISLNEFQKPVGIGELVTGTSEEASFSLYPNPATDQVVVSFSNESAVKVTFNLYNISGQLVKSFDQGNISSGDHNIKVNFQDLKAGMYIFQLIQGTSSSSSKLIIN